MRILAISNLFPPFVVGGYEINCRNVINELIDRGHVVQVLTTPSHNRPFDVPAKHVDRCLVLHSAFTPRYNEGVTPLHDLYLGDCSNYFNIYTIFNSILNFKPNIVFLWNIHGLGGLHIIDLLNQLEMPRAIYLGDRVFEQITRPFPKHIRSIFRGNDANYFASGKIFSVSKSLTQEIETLADFSFPQEPTHVYGYLFPGVSFKKHSLYQKDGFTRFVYAGRIGEHKGIKVICDAVCSLLLQGVKNFRVDLYGDGDINHFVGYSRRLNIHEYVFFHGAVSQQELSNIYSKSDAFLFPTWEREPFAFAPFEAAAFGCLPILTSTCGCAERLVDGVHCIKAERDSSSFSNAMLLLINKQVNIAKMAPLAAQMVREDLTFKHHVDIIESGLFQESGTSKSFLNFSEDFLLRQFLKHNLGLSLFHQRID